MDRFISEDFNDSTPSERTPPDKDRYVANWLNERSVKVLEKISDTDADNSSWLRQVGVLELSQTYLATTVATQKFLGHDKDFGDGWRRAGAESFYKILHIEYRQQGSPGSKLVALKAIHSTGGGDIIKSKVLTEAVRMAYFHELDRAGRVYAVAPGVLFKEFLPEDSVEMPPERKEAEQTELKMLLHKVGLVPIRLETLQHQGKLKLIDLGTGDISGLDADSFIQQFS